MVKKSKSDAAKNILWPGATPFLAFVSRQNPFGLRGSLPATVNWLRCRQFCFLPRLSQTVACQHSAGNSCQSLLANSARTRWQFLP